MWRRERPSKLVPYIKADWIVSTPLPPPCHPSISAVLKRKSGKAPEDLQLTLPTRELPMGGIKAQEEWRRVGRGRECVRQSAKRVSDWASGILCLCRHVHKRKSFSSAYVHAHAGSWVSSAQGFDVTRHSLSLRQLMKLQWDVGGPRWAGPQGASAWIHIKRTVSPPARTASSVLVLV